MSFLAPLASLFALLAIPIILLYMLRLRRREMVVSSNFLWQQILRDREANTPWQKLKRNLLLLLQLLILILLVLALMRPAQVVPAITSGRTVILLDASASMNATDINNGNTRFEEAQREASELIFSLSSGDEISVIRVGENAEPLITYTDDFNAARNAVLNAQAGQGAGDWDTALTLAAAGAEGTENFNIVIISDGGITDTGRLPENIPAPIYIPIGESGGNIAITALATRALPNQNPQLFAQVQNYNPEAVDISLLVSLDGEFWESVSPTISGASSRSFVFEVDEPFETIQAELVLDDDVTDFLEADNVAYSVVNDSSTRRVLLLSNQTNVFLDEVLRSLPNVQIFRGDVTNPVLPSTPYDLYVFNNYLPTTLPDADMLIINPPVGTDIFTLDPSENEQATNPTIISRNHPLAAFVTLETINLRAFNPISDVDDWETTIATTDGGGIIYAGENQGRQIAVMNFNLLDSDLPLQIAFPIMMSNMIEWASPANIVSGGITYTIGDLVRVNPPTDADGVSVSFPDGEERNLVITGDTIIFPETRQAGFYDINILEGATASTTQTIAVNLFGTNESNITPITEDALVLGGGLVEGEEREQFGFREWWRPLLVLALIILMYEWYLYFERLKVPTNVDGELRRTTARN